MSDQASDLNEIFNLIDADDTRNVPNAIFFSDQISNYIFVN